MKHHIVACIFARGGSKGVPKKNIRLLSGKPLIAYAIEVALDCDLIHEVLVSTDDPNIAEIAKEHGAQIPFMRPDNLAGDSSPEILSWQHAIQILNSRNDSKPIDIFVSVPPTSPLRNADDLTHCIEAFVHDDVDIVISVKEAERNPYFNMVTVDKDGYAKIAISPKDGVGITRRQDAPVLYDVTTVAYVARPEFIMTTDSIYSGKVKAVVIPKERALDIDTELDFYIAECLMKRNHFSE